MVGTNDMSVRLLALVVLVAGRKVTDETDLAYFSSQPARESLLYFQGYSEHTS